MTALPAPAWLWPSSNQNSSQELNYGLTGALHYAEADFGSSIFSSGNIPQSLLNDGWIRANQPVKGPPVLPLTVLRRSFPCTKLYRPTPQSFGKQDLYLSLKHFQVHYPEVYVPPDLLSKHLSEGHRIQLETELDDPFLGNLFDLCQINISKEVNTCAVFPMGVLGNELNISLLNPRTLKSDLDSTSPVRYKLHRLQSTAEPAISFKTPIRQICSSTSSCSMSGVFKDPLLAVRTHTGVTILRLNNPDYRDSPPGPAAAATAEVLDEITPWSEGVVDSCAMHVAMNPYWPGEACVLGADGGVLLWNALRRIPVSNVQDNSKIYVFRDPTARLNIPYSNLWMSCDYGAHPRSILIASAMDGLGLLDLRSDPSTTPARLYTLRPNSLLRAFRRPPVGHTFQTFLATNKEVLVVDQRFPGRPMMTWEHHHGQDPPCGIEVLEEEGCGDERSTILLTWSHHNSAIIAYRYTSSATGAYPPISTANPISLPTFASHPLYTGSPDETSATPCRNKLRKTVAIPPLVGVRVIMGMREAERKQSSANGGDEAGEAVGDTNELPGRFTLFQLAGSGEVYDQGFCFSGDDGSVAEALLDIDVVDDEKSRSKRSKCVRQLESKLEVMKDEKMGWKEVDLAGLLEYLTKELLPVSEGQKHDGNAGDMNVMLSSASPSPTAGTKASEWLKASLHPLTLHEILKHSGNETARPQHMSSASSLPFAVTSYSADFEAYLSHILSQLDQGVTSWSVLPQGNSLDTEDKAESMAELVETFKYRYLFPKAVASVKDIREMKRIEKEKEEKKKRKEERERKKEERERRKAREMEEEKKEQEENKLEDVSQSNSSFLDKDELLIEMEMDDNPVHQPVFPVSSAPSVSLPPTISLPPATSSPSLPHDPKTVARSAWHQAIFNLARDIRLNTKVLEHKQGAWRERGGSDVPDISTLNIESSSSLDFRPFSQLVYGGEASSDVNDTRQSFVFKHLLTGAPTSNHYDTDEDSDGLSPSETQSPWPKPKSRRSGPILSKAAHALLNEWHLGEDPRLYEYVDSVNFDEVPKADQRRAKRHARNQRDKGKNPEFEYEAVYEGPKVVAASAAPRIAGSSAQVTWRDDRQYHSQPALAPALSQESQVQWMEDVTASQPVKGAFAGRKKKKTRAVGF